MRKLPSALALVLLMIDPASGQPLAKASADATAEASGTAAAIGTGMGRYFQCALSYARRFVKTAASAGDIADAALSACMDQSKALSVEAVRAFGVEKSMSMVDGVMANARRRAIQTVIEARYPTN